MGSNTRFASHRATTRPRYRRIGVERAMGIEPTSEAWEACNLTQKTLDWRHFCDFRNASIGK